MKESRIDGGLKLNSVKAVGDVHLDGLTSVRGITFEGSTYDQRVILSRVQCPDSPQRTNATFAVEPSWGSVSVP
ncbi:hypothetical protein GCM10010461_26300 [Microbacterium aurantiacum]